jgi:hypothetical protein
MIVLSFDALPEIAALRPNFVKPCQLSREISRLGVWRNWLDAQELSTQALNEVSELLANLMVL